MAYETSTVAMQTTLSKAGLLQTPLNLLTSTPQYESLTINMTGALISRSHFSYERLNNDMWEEIFPVDTNFPARQHQPVLFDMSQLSGFLTSKPNNKTVQRSNENEVDCVSSLASNVIYSRNAGSNTAPSLTHTIMSNKVMHNPYEELSSDIWKEIFPVTVSEQYEDWQEQYMQISKIVLEEKAKRIRDIFSSERKRNESLEIFFNDDATQDDDVGCRPISFLTVTNSPPEFYSKDLHNADQEIGGHSSSVRTSRIQRIRLSSSIAASLGNEYECIREYEHIHELTTTECDTQPPTSGPLPMIPPRRTPRNMNDPLRLKLEGGIFKAGKIVSNRVCKPVYRILLVVTIVLTVIIATSLIATRVFDRDSGDNAVEETTKTVENENRLSARSFLENPSILGVIHTDGHINGITVMGGQLFLIRNGSSQVDVFTTNNFKLTGNITISGSRNLQAIVASPRNNCLYICDGERDVIYRYSLSDDVIISRDVGGECSGLSLTSKHNVFVTLHDAKQIREYTPDMNLIGVVDLNGSISDPWHGVQLSSGQIVVSDSGSAHRVCVVNSSGQINHCYRGSHSRGIDQLRLSKSIYVDRYDNILVADYDSNTVVLLGPSLTHLGYVKIPGHTLIGPYALHLDELNNRLYVVEWRGRVFVLIV